MSNTQPEKKGNLGSMFAQPGQHFTLGLPVQTSPLNSCIKRGKDGQSLNREKNS